MYKGISIALLVIGVILIFWGINSSESFNSEVSEIFTGSPSDKSMQLLIGGAAAGIIGLCGLVFSVKSAR